MFVKLIRRIKGYLIIILSLLIYQEEYVYESVAYFYILIMLLNTT